MINTRFEAYKLDRVLKRNGKEYSFHRYAKDQYGNASGYVGVCDLIGIFHETTLPNSYIDKTTSDSGITELPKYTAILCRYEDAKCIALKDAVEVGNDVYFVTGVSNIQNLNIYADVCIERMLKAWV